MEKEINGIIIDPADNVATLFESVKPHREVKVRLKVEIRRFKVLEKIPMGHKFAIKDIEQGDSIIKYGESIGVVTKDISKGEHVHVQNVESRRGRGDVD